MSTHLLHELREKGYALSLTSSVANFDTGGRSSPKLSVRGPNKPDEKLHRRIADEAPRLKLALLLEDPPEWFLRQMDLCMDPASPVKLRNRAAAVAYHVGGLEGWRDVVADVADALIEREPDYLRRTGRVMACPC